MSKTLTNRIPAAVSLMITALIAMSGCASANPPEQPAPEAPSASATTTPPSDAPSPTAAATAVNPQDYEVHGGGGWRFYTENNINCIISKTTACIGAPLPGTDSKYTVATITDAKAQMSWSDTQLKPFGDPFDATRYGQLLPSGSSLSVPPGQCSVNGQVIVCTRGEHSFTIDPTGSTTR